MQPMKHFLPTLLFFFIAISSSAQSHRFADSTAQWNVIENDPWDHSNPVSTITYNAVGDTAINGALYQVMENSIGFETSNLTEREFIRKDSIGRVFCLRQYDSLEYLIYDFSKSIGDTVVIYDYSDWFSVNASMVVDSVDSIEVDRLRKRMFVRAVGGSVFFSSIWIEGIGCINDYFGHPFHPIKNLGFTDANSYELLCFHEYEQTLYQNEKYESCLYNISVGVERVNQIVTSIYPNPSSSSFAVTLSQQPQPNTAILIYNNIGALVKQEELTTSTQQIDVAELPNGIYTYAITQQGVRLASGKMIIAK